MATIYLDTAALHIAGGAGASDAFSVGAGSDRLVGHLVGSGHRVVLIGDASQLHDALAALSPDDDLTSLPAPLPGGSTIDAIPGDAIGWLITDSAEACAAARARRRLRTILIGGSTADQDLAHRRADRLARSLGDAVLEILASEAMPQRAPEALP